MFFRKSERHHEAYLINVVEKGSKTGFVFWDINDDLGNSVKAIMDSTPRVKMAYGYARRAAIAALCIQGIVDADNFAHVVSIFKALQVQTGHTMEFQESAARDAEVFMQTYTHQINSLFLKKVVAISLGYKVSGEKMSDGEFFAAVIDTMYREQEEMLGRARRGSHSF